MSAERPSTSRLRVILAGHNGDVEVLRGGEGDFSPETLSAAYARISRYPEPVPVLREQARAEVGKARKSNRTIVFGLGHHSVAEHAVLNFDILGCSRLAIEALEWHRLCSYTEKSQRYITLDDDYVVPAEFEPAEVERFRAVLALQHQAYHRLLPALQRRQESLHPDMLDSKGGRNVVEGWAKEDARYAVALATEGQLGFTSNARNLELIVRRMRQAPLAEVRELGAQLHAQAQEIAPSLIVLADDEAFQAAYGTTIRDGYFREGARDLAAAAALVDVGEPARAGRQRGDVTLIDHTADPDAAVISALLFAAGRGSLAGCVAAARDLGVEERAAVIRRLFVNLSEYDSPPRAFEEAVFRFEIVIDASAMAQLKRHRMATQHWGGYDPGLGYTVPPEVVEIGEGDRFAALMDQTAEAYHHLERALLGRGQTGHAAAYVLTNAHRRRVALTLNLREIYHFSRLRDDGHAQWAIRRIAGDLSALVREVAPATAQLLAGKDGFAARFAAVMAEPG